MLEQPLTKNELEVLLREQTETILNAVDGQLRPIREDITELKEGINQLVTTLDVFLKRMTALEEEFDVMKHDLRRVKGFLKEKLGFEFE